MQHKNEKPGVLNSDEEDSLYFNAEEVQIIRSTKKWLADNCWPLEGIIGVEKELKILHNKCFPLIQACLRAIWYVCAQFKNDWE